jgi:hypothetical protein
VLVSLTCHTYILSPSTHGPDLGRSWPAARLADDGAPSPSPRHCLAANRAPLAQPVALPSPCARGCRGRPTGGAAVTACATGSRPRKRRGAPPPVTCGHCSRGVPRGHRGRPTLREAPSLIRLRHRLQHRTREGTGALGAREQDVREK